MFNRELIAALILLAAGRTSDDYFERQQALADNLPATYAELVDVAYDHEEPSVRMEAIEIVAIAQKDGYKVVLSDLMKADPDEKVRKHAEALLFRVLVNERLRKEVLKPATSQ